MTDWPIGVHISAPTQPKRPERTHHDQASSYKELCKGKATELYPHFQELFYNSVLLKYLMLLCCSNVLQ